MRYAIISDIHGNMPSLNAVLKDTAMQNIDRFIFVGDYYTDLPFPNEVIYAIRKIDNAYVIRGNKEDYLLNLAKQDQSTWTDEQLYPLYWNYTNLTDSNLKYLSNLPKELIVKENDGTYIHAFHAHHYVFNTSKLSELSSSNFSIMMRNSPISQVAYLKYVNELLLSDDNLKDTLKNLSDGIYIFGHSHVQWHVELNNKLIINPGSCGMPLNFDSAAAYTILDTGLNSCSGDWKVEERRIPYDIDSAINALKDSEIYTNAKIWADLVIKNIQTGEDNISFFLRYVHKLATELNNEKKPYPNELWHLAAAKWRDEGENHI